MRLPTRVADMSGVGGEAGLGGHREAADRSVAAVPRCIGDGRGGEMGVSQSVRVRAEGSVEGGHAAVRGDDCLGEGF